MARQRIIKPEIWTSEQFTGCSFQARLLFIGLWNFADDQGVHPASAARAKMEVFPADPITIEEVEAAALELVQAELLLEYEAEDKSYWHITGFGKHQSIKHPNYRHPKPPERSGSVTDILPERSGNVPPAREEKRREEKRNNPPTPQGGKRSVFDPLKVEIPKPLDTPRFRESWTRWVKFRREKNKRLTPTSVEQQFADLLEWGEAKACEAIATSIRNTWTGLFPPDARGSPRNPAEADLDALTKGFTQ